MVAPFFFARPFASFDVKLARGLQVQRETAPHLVFCLGKPLGTEAHP